MDGNGQYRRLLEKIGVTLSDFTHLESALTHSSSGSAVNYERLEFLGDRVLGLVIAESLFIEFPGENEGDLAKRHAALVQGRVLADVARGLDLGSFISLSEAERAAGGADNENILADAMEAVIGALYLDLGLEACRHMIKGLWADKVHTMATPPQDPKTALQEWAQARGLPLPVYEIIDRQGPDHAPVFEIRVSVQGAGAAAARGSSRRAAEKDAAEKLLNNVAGDAA